MIACQTWGLTTRYVGKLGEDDAARLHRREFARAGVDARILTAPHAASAHSLILVDDGGERTVLCQRNEQVLLRPEDLRQEWIVNARALLVDGFETAAAVQAASWAREAGFPVIADLDEMYRWRRTPCDQGGLSGCEPRFSHADDGRAQSRARPAQDEKPLRVCRDGSDIGPGRSAGVGMASAFICARHTA